MINTPSPPLFHHKPYKKNITTSRPSALHPSRAPYPHPGTNIHNQVPTPAPATSLFSLISTAATTALKRGPRRPRSPGRD